MTDDSGTFRTGTARDLGRLEARLDTLEVRLDKQDEQVAAGFKGIHEKLDNLMATELKRKGAMGLIKILLGGGTLAGAFEGVKAWLGK